MPDQEPQTSDKPDPTIKGPSFPKTKTAKTFGTQNRATVRSFFVQRHYYFLHRVAQIDWLYKWFCILMMLLSFAICTYPPSKDILAMIHAGILLAIIIVALLCDRERSAYTSHAEELERLIGHIVRGPWEDYLIRIKYIGEDLSPFHSKQPSSATPISENERAAKRMNAYIKATNALMKRDILFWAIMTMSIIVMLSTIRLSIPVR